MGVWDFDGDEYDDDAHGDDGACNYPFDNQGAAPITFPTNG